MGLQIYNRIFFTYIRSVGIGKKMASFFDGMKEGFNRMKGFITVSKKNGNILYMGNIARCVSTCPEGTNQILGLLIRPNNHTIPENLNLEIINAKITDLHDTEFLITELNKIYTPLDIAACLFDEEKVDAILNRQYELKIYKKYPPKIYKNYPPSIYLRDPVEMIHRKRGPNEIIASIYCLNEKICEWFRKNSDKINIDENTATYIENLTQKPLENLTQQNWVRNYQKMEKNRGGLLTIGLIIEIIFSIGLPLDWVILGPVLLMWRRIIKGAQVYLDDYFLINGSRGCYKFYITPKYGDKNFVYRYRAFLKQTVCIAPLSSCEIPKTLAQRMVGGIKDKLIKNIFPAIGIFNTKEKVKLNATCEAEVERSKEIFKIHWEKYTFYGNRIIKSKTCRYNMLHFIILSDRKDLYEILKVKAGPEKMKRLREDECKIQIPNSHCIKEVKNDICSGEKMLKTIWGMDTGKSDTDKLYEEIRDESPTSIQQIQEFFPIA